MNICKSQIAPDFICLCRAPLSLSCCANLSVTCRIGCRKLLRSLSTNCYKNASDYRRQKSDNDRRKLALFKSGKFFFDDLTDNVVIDNFFVMLRTVDQTVGTEFVNQAGGAG